MNLLNIDGSEFAAAPHDLAAAAPTEIGRAFMFRGVAFVRLSHGLRFYDARERAAWTAREALTGA